jgi:NAD(P)-dependent dehydrogenase (short-subunit alcohol dehydrogenase family)
VALVTGGASGIGRATALLLAAEGAAVMIADRDTDGASQVARAVREAGRVASASALDVTDETAWERTLDQLLAEFRRLDVAVNCAGVVLSKALTDTTLAEWRSVLAVNLDGAFLGTRAAIRAMRPWRRGSIVNVSSSAGVRAIPGAAAYCASKAGLDLLTRVAARECAAEGLLVRVNAVLPGCVTTPIWRQMPIWAELVAQAGGEEGAWQALARSVPLKRYATPEEVAHAILYLASDESAYVTGTELIIDGGLTA